MFYGNGASNVKRSSAGIARKTLMIVISVLSAVALPQLFHVLGRMIGVGTLAGEVYLPMHLPIIIAGIVAGPMVAVAAGAIAPLMSYAITGMPNMTMLPFMMLELFVYGLSAGVIAKSMFSDAGDYYKADNVSHGWVTTFCKYMLVVLGAQIAGRVIRGIAILIAFNVTGGATIPPAIITSSVVTGLPGIGIQLVLIPLLMTLIVGRDERR